MRNPARFRLYGGAKGGGKSYAMRMECVRQSTSAQNVRGLALRRTFPEIEENMVTPMIGELPHGSYDYNSTKGILTFQNGSTIRFGYCRNYKDVLQYQGIEYDFICIEEVTHWAEREFKVLKTCLRTARSGIVPNFFGSTNPGGIGHAWVRRLWVDRQFSRTENPEDYAFIPARVYDNQILMQANPQYVKDLEDLPEMDRRAYLMGDWDVFEGQYFTEFNRDIHVIDPMIPKIGVKARIVALDYGFDPSPSCALWMALMNNGDVIVYRELYEKRLLFRALAQRIAALTAEDEDIRLIIADPSIVEKETEAGNTFSMEFKECDLITQGGNNKRIEGWNVVRQLLHPYVDPNLRRHTARLKITSNCRNLIRTLPEQIHDERDVEDLNTKGEDHAVDALRYGVMELCDNIQSVESLAAVNDSLIVRRNSSASSLSDKDEENGDPSMKEGAYASPTHQDMLDDLGDAGAGGIMNLRF
jgi:phage terminase large subunit